MILPVLMTEERYRVLDRLGEGLTPEEIASGWHYCFEWDGMLIGPGMPEMRVCICEGVNHDYDDYPRGNFMG